MAPPAVTSPFAANPGPEVTEVRDAASANPGHEARAAEEGPKQNEKSKPKPEQSNPKPEARVELSSSDSGDSDQTVPTKAAPKSPESPDSVESTDKEKDKKAEAPKMEMPKTRRNRRSLEEGMVKCPICWTAVKKDGLESHQLHSAYCAEWKKFMEGGKKEKKDGGDEKNEKKSCSYCGRSFNRRWDLLQHCLRSHPTKPEAQECWAFLNAKKAQHSGSAAAGSGADSANRPVRLRSRTRQSRQRREASESRRQRREASESRDSRRRPESSMQPARSRSRRRHSEPLLLGRSRQHETRDRRSRSSPTPSSSSRPGRTGAATVLESFLQTTTRILDMQDRK